MLKLSPTIFLIGLLTFLGFLFVSKEAQAACTSVLLSGSYTATTSCTFDGTVSGAEKGNLTILPEKTLTIQANQTIAWNPGYSVFIQGSIAINLDGGQLRKTYLWYIDAEADGFPDTVNQVAAATAPSNGVRRSDPVFTARWSYVLVNCGPGYYLPADACSEAGLGYYSPDENPKRYECGGNNYYCPTATNVAPTTVSSGYYSTGGTSTTRTGQSQCTAGNYCVSGVSNAASAGYYVPTAGAASQTACGDNNYYCPGTGNIARTTVTSGYYSTGGDSTTRTGQSICEANYYCVSGVKTACAFCTFSNSGSSSCASVVTFTYKGSQVSYGTVVSQGECWMDRNLGASQVATAYNDANAYGDLFQWGRKDDGHQTRSPAPSTVEGDMSLTDQPGHGNFITEQSSPYDWASNAWTSRWTVAASDPCPEGWRVPTNTELSTEEASWAQQNYNGAFASPLKLTAGGHRGQASGSLSDVGSYGYYWSSVVSGSNAYALYFRSSDSYVTSYRRAFGFSVRCVKD